MPHVPPPMIRMGLVFEGGGCVEGIVVVMGRLVLSVGMICLMMFLFNQEVNKVERWKWELDYVVSFSLSGPSLCRLETRFSGGLLFFSGWKDEILPRICLRVSGLYNTSTISTLTS